MQLHYTQQFKQDYKRLPKNIQKTADKQLSLLIENPRHPSLQIRKLRSDPTGKIWYGRISRDYRFTFEIEGEFYILRGIGKHNEIL